MTPLDERFVAAMAALDQPERDLVDGVMAAVSTVDTERSAAPSFPRRFRPFPAPTAPGRRRASLASLALIVVLVIGSVLVLTPARGAVADWLGIGSTRVVVQPGAGGVDEGPSPGTGTGADSAAALGQPVVGAAVVDRNPIPLLGPPAAVFDDVQRGRSYTWVAGDKLPPLGGGGTGLVLSVRPDDREVVTKLVEPATEVEFVTIEGPEGPVPGLWIGGTHTHVAAGSSRPVVAQRVLLWEWDGVEYRLEADLGRDALVALAGAVEEGTDLLVSG